MPAELTGRGADGAPLPSRRRFLVAATAALAALVPAPLAGAGRAFAKDGGDRGGGDDGGRGRDRDDGGRGRDDGGRGRGRDDDRRKDDDRRDDRSRNGRRDRGRDDDRVVVEVGGDDTVTVRHPGGWREIITRGRIRVVDPWGRVIVDRRIRKADRSRLEALMR